MELPRLYAILDAESVAARGMELPDVALSLRRGGVQLLQYRDKRGSARAVLANARAIGAIFAGSGCMLILNDRAELVREAGWNGVHLGQEDGVPSDARALVGEGGVIGLSTHTAAQALAAERDAAVDYVAIGPVFATRTKSDAEAVVGVAGVSAARALVRKPLVGIGGISWESAGQVISAGADAVAVIAALLVKAEAIEEQTRALIAATEGAQRLQRAN